MQTNSAKFVWTEAEKLKHSEVKPYQIEQIKKELNKIKWIGHKLLSTATFYFLHNAEFWIFDPSSGSLPEQQHQYTLSYNSLKYSNFDYPTQTSLKSSGFEEKKYFLLTS